MRGVMPIKFADYLQSGLPVIAFGPFEIPASFSSKIFQLNSFNPRCLEKMASWIRGLVDSKTYSEENCTDFTEIQEYFSVESAAESYASAFNRCLFRESRSGDI